jgi:glycerate kinase
MTVLIAPDKFKGSLSAREVSENIALGIRDVLPDAKIETMPMADGGEGTATVISDALGGEWVHCKAHDPIGRVIDCRYAIIARSLAVIEMSEAAGLQRLKENERDPLRTTTFGVGEMLLHAARRGVTKIIVGLGGSATNDGGFGMARTFGFRFFGESDVQLRAAIAKLCELRRIEKPRTPSLPSIVGAADVKNPLLGKRGATETFGPQKGATPQKLDILERALTRLADVAGKEFRFDHRDHFGAGAAGGLGFGLLTFAGAVLKPGFDVVAEAVGLESKMKDADVVITGEGALDLQTLEGKVPAGVARLARKLGKRVFAIPGRASEEREVRELFQGVVPLVEAGISERQAIADIPVLLRKRASTLARDFLVDGGAR